MSGDGVFIGLMSGTSLDGISAAAVRIASNEGGGVDARLIAFVETPYTREQRERLAAALVGATPAEYCRIAFDLGEWFAGATVAVIAEAGVARAEVRAIGSHGQTVWHEPPHSTWQIGESAVIAERLGIDVISDFRVADVAAGGQGAPLVPIADALLFSSPDRWRALQNIGGIGNVTVVPPRGELSGVRAFDTGPGVAVIDGVVRALEPSLPYDVDGALAMAGSPIDAVLDELLADPYFAAAPPKSTGRELFTPAYVERLTVLCHEQNPGATTADIVATATALTARSIADAYARFLPEPIDEVMVSGGGARNPALMRMLGDALVAEGLPSPEPFGSLGDAKEAIAFALLAHLHLEGRAGNVPTATGARGPRVLGKLTPAPGRARG
jgi:anhydro-N-acetylmuramic acid kinase